MACDCPSEEIDCPYNRTQSRGPSGGLVVNEAEGRSTVPSRQQPALLSPGWCSLVLSGGTPGGSCRTLQGKGDVTKRRAAFLPRPKSWVRANGPFRALSLAGWCEASRAAVALSRSRRKGALVDPAPHGLLDGEPLGSQCSAQERASFACVRPGARCSPGCPPRSSRSPPASRCDLQPMETDIGTRAVVRRADGLRVAELRGGNPPTPRAPRRSPRSSKRPCPHSGACIG